MGHTAIVCKGQLIGVFTDDHPILEDFRDYSPEAIRRRFKGFGVGWIYAVPVDNRLYDEWRKFIEGKRKGPLDLQTSRIERARASLSGKDGK